MSKTKTNFFSFHKTNVSGLITQKFTSQKGNEVYFIRKLFELENGNVGGEHYTITFLNGKKDFDVGQVINVKGSLILSIDTFKGSTFIKKSIITDFSQKYGNSVQLVQPTSDEKLMIANYLKD